MAATKKKSGLEGKSSLIAVGLLAVLGIWAWVFERGEVREPDQTPPVSEMVGMKPDDVTRVELLHDGQATVLAKTPPTPSSQGGARGGSGSGWRLEKPVQARADDAQVKQVLEGLLNGNVDQVMAEKVTDMKPYGLDKPAFQATLSDAKGHQKLLQTGSKDVRGFSVYARASDNPQLFLLSAYSIDNVVKKKPDDLRDKTVLALDPNSITHLSLQTPSQMVRAEKQGQKWQLTAPQAAPADADTVKAVLDQIKELKADRFEGAGVPASRCGLAPARLTVTLSGPAGEKGLLLGKATPDGKDVYAMRPGENEVFDLPKSAFDDLSKKPGDLRDKTLLSFKRDDATRITITSPAQTLELTHAGKDWNVASLQGSETANPKSKIQNPKSKTPLGKAAEDKVSTLLFTLEVVKGSRLVEEKPANLAKYGLDKPEMRVEVALPKGPQELLIGKKTSATEYYARSNSQEAVFTVPDFTVTDLKVKPGDLEQLPPAVVKK
jgi:uncharacterized protein DUF4340